MAQTPLTSATAYAAPADLFARADIRNVGDWASDDGTRHGGSPNPNPAILATDANVLTALLDASGELESACLVGGRYLPVDLAVLLAVNPSAGRNVVLDLVCGLALGKLYRRRPNVGTPVPAQTLEAQGKLQALAAGERILPFQETADAGRVADSVELVTDVEKRWGATYQAARLFGRRADRADPTRGGGW